MKESNRKTGSTKRKRKSQMEEVDAQLERTDFSEVATGQAIKMADVHEARRKRGRPSVGKRRSIILPDELVERIQRIADKFNVGGYQPMIRLILSEKLEEYEKRAKKG